MPSNRVRLKADIEFDLVDGREVEVACNRIRSALDSLRATGDAGPDPTTVVVSDVARAKPRRQRLWNGSYKSQKARDAEDEEE